MVWFFERGNQTVECEVQRRSTHFEIIVRRPDGTRSSEIVHGASNLLAQIERMPEKLGQEGWRPRPGDPLLLLSTRST